MEKAEMLPSATLSAALDEYFGTAGHFVRLDALVRQSQEIHPEQYRRSMQMEARARLIEVYGAEIIPGIVQTGAYARALIRAANPDASDERIEELVTARLSRKDLLRSETPPKLSVVLSEAAVRRTVGGPAAMRDQLTAVLDLVDTATTVVQLIPFDHGEHGLLGGELKLMTLHDGAVVAWEESIDSGTLLENPKAVIPRQHKYNLLRSHALPPRQTATFIQSVVEELHA